ncbi:MAG: hypothetical protein JWO22_3620 [Frankiales bacterium]|nr:hypothetical protein [Frankiales bacterium]
MDEILAGVVSEARGKDPSLPAEAAAELASRALALPLDADAAEIARVLIEGDQALDVSWANAVATSVVGLR